MKEGLLDKAPCGIFSFFDDGSIFIVNETLCNWLGYSKQELEGQNLDTIFTLPTRIFHQTHFFPLVRMHGHAEEIFVSLLTKEKEHLPVLLNARREENGSRSYTACACIVVVNRKKFEDELIAARRQAEMALKENTALIRAKEELQQHAEQLDTQMHLVNRQNHELKQLNHVITHSLKEPLRKMLLFSGKLQEADLPAAAMDSLERLVRSSNQMRNVVVGLQQYIWLDDTPAVFSQLDLDAVLASAAKRLRDETGKDELFLETDQLPSVEGDEAQLGLLFYHLLYNAVKFKKNEKVRVRVTASLIQRNKFRGLEGKYLYEDFIQIEVSDDGMGFDPNASETIFELFRKLHYNEGSGLGLALCRKITDNHFGSIKAFGKINEGAVITVSLPVRQSFELRRRSQASPHF